MLELFDRMAFATRGEAREALPLIPSIDHHHYRIMLFSFKSKATGNLIMLEPSGRRLLEIIGKIPGHEGIILPDEMPGATVALQAAVEREEVEHQAAINEARARDEIPPGSEEVSLRQRALPFLDMLQQSGQAGEVIVWGV